jgi:hypothetical protein
MAHRLQKSRAMARLAALFLSVTAFLVAAPTRADSFSTLPIVQRADEMLTQNLPLPVLERADAVLVRAMPTLFERGKMEERSIPMFAMAHHQVTLGEYSVHVSKKINVRGGAGFAEIVDAPMNFAMARTGAAVGGGINYRLAQVKGFRVALDFSALHVRYGAVGMTDESILLALSTR